MDKLAGCGHLIAFGLSTVVDELATSCQSLESLIDKGFWARKLSAVVVRVLGMELVEARPVWSMDGGELLTTLDQLHAEAAARETYRLQIMDRLDEIGHAKELGARDVIELLAMRHRLDPAAVRSDLKLAKTLSKYPVVTAALPDPFAVAALTARSSTPKPMPMAMAQPSLSTSLVRGSLVSGCRCFCMLARPRRS